MSEGDKNANDRGGSLRRGRSLLDRSGIDHFGRREVLDRLVKQLLQSPAHQRNRMLSTIELDAIQEHQPDVRNKLVRGKISRLIGLWNLFPEYGIVKLLFDRLEIHGVSDDLRIMRDVHGHDIDGEQERSCIF